MRKNRTLGQRARKFTGRAVAFVAAAAVLIGSGCAAWRDVATVPTYELKRRSRRGSPEVWEQNGRISIFRTIDSNAPLYNENSLELRNLQRGVGHKVAAAPAFLVELVYLIGVSPALYVSMLIGAPAHFDDESGMDTSINAEPEYWEDYPWWFFTRGVYLLDAIFYDIPYIMVMMPVRAFTKKHFEWKERVELAPEGGLAPEHSYFTGPANQR